MTNPTTKEIETTIGKITVRAMRKKEFEEMRKLERSLRRAGDDDTRDEINDQIEEYYERFITLEEGADFSDIEMGEYTSIINAVNELSRNSQKN